MCTNLDKLMLLLTLTLMLLMYYEKCTYKSRKCANCFILIIYILLQDLVQNLKKLLQIYIYHLSNLQSYAFAFLLNISTHVRPICILGSAALPARRGRIETMILLGFFFFASANQTNSSLFKSDQQFPVSMAMAPVDTLAKNSKSQIIDDYRQLIRVYC